MELREKLPGISKAALEIAYDNGGINRGRSEDDCLKELAAYLQENWLSATHSGLKTILYANLLSIDRWLDQLSAEDLSTACAGEETEADAILVGSPPQTNELLNGIFNHVC